MTCQTEDNPVDYAVEHLIESSLNGVAEAIGLLLSTASSSLGINFYDQDNDSFL